MSYQVVADRYTIFGGCKNRWNGIIGTNSCTARHVLPDGSNWPLHSRFHHTTWIVFRGNKKESLSLSVQHGTGIGHRIWYIIEFGDITSCHKLSRRKKRRWSTNNQICTTDRCNNKHGRYCFVRSSGRDFYIASSRSQPHFWTISGDQVKSCNSLSLSLFFFVFSILIC